jgi:hypothetical protein
MFLIIWVLRVKMRMERICNNLYSKNELNDDNFHFRTVEM